MIQKEEIAMKTDAKLQQDVMDELKWEPTIPRRRLVLLSRMEW